MMCICYTAQRYSELLSSGSHFAYWLSNGKHGRRMLEKLPVFEENRKWLWLSAF